VHDPDRWLNNYWHKKSAERRIFYARFIASAELAVARVAQRGRCSRARSMVVTAARKIGTSGWCLDRFSIPSGAPIKPTNLILRTPQFLRMSTVATADPRLPASVQDQVTCTVGSTAACCNTAPAQRLLIPVQANVPDLAEGIISQMPSTMPSPAEDRHQAIFSCSSAPIMLAIGVWISFGLTADRQWLVASNRKFRTSSEISSDWCRCCANEKACVGSKGASRRINLPSINSSSGFVLL